MGFLSDIIEAFVPSNIEKLYTEDIPQATAPDISFKPFTVAGPTGTISAGGTTQYNLSPSGQALQDALEAGALSRFGATPAGVGQLGTAAEQAMGLGWQFMGQISMPMGAREQEVYDRIRATQLAEEERQRLALEEGLVAQSRAGVRTAMFGGERENFGLGQAHKEA